MPDPRGILEKSLWVLNGAVFRFAVVPLRYKHNCSQTFLPLLFLLPRGFPLPLLCVIGHLPPRLNDSFWVAEVIRVHVYFTYELPLPESGGVDKQRMQAT